MSEKSDFQKAFDDYRLTTAELIYHLPDHPALLQSYIWQDFDLPPDYPRLQEFVEFWLKSIEGRLHSIRVMHADPLISNDYINAIFAAHLQ